MNFMRPATCYVGPLLLAAVVAGHPGSVSGELLVYKGFDYGLANGTTMNGVSANATGLTANYTVTDSAPTGGGSGLSLVSA